MVFNIFHNIYNMQIVIVISNEMIHISMWLPGSIALSIQGIVLIDTRNIVHISTYMFI